jgi:hypothetical protein
VERVRINSEQLNTLLAKFAGLEKAPETWESHIRPFKLLLSHEQKLRDHFEDLVAKYPETPIEETSLDANDQVKQENIAESSAKSVSTDQPVVDGQAETDEPGKSIKSEKTLKDHLQSLLSFTDTSLKNELATHPRLRSRTAVSHETKVLFGDLWHLLHPGSVVFSPGESQALLVLSVRGCRPLLLKARTEGEADDDKSFRTLAAVIQDEMLSPFEIECAHMDFNGKEIGWVQSPISIAPYEGTKLVTALQIYPIEYAEVLKDQSATAEISATGPVPSVGLDEQLKGGDSEPSEPANLQEILRRRGSKFARLANASVVAHKEYNGFSLETFREHVCLHRSIRSLVLTALLISPRLIARSSWTSSSSIKNFLRAYLSLA